MLCVDALQYHTVHVRIVLCVETAVRIVLCAVARSSGLLDTLSLKDNCRAATRDIYPEEYATRLSRRARTRTHVTHHSLSPEPTDGLTHHIAVLKVGNRRAGDAGRGSR